MGSDMARRLMKDGHEVVVSDLNQAAVTELVAEGAIGSRDVADAVTKLSAPRVVWSMVPAGQATESVVHSAIQALSKGDIVVDGANSNWNDSLRRAADAAAAGLGWLDAGVSGGVWGLQEGYNLMVGGDADAFAQLKPVLVSLAPENGLLHVGPAGSGHFVKMIHNGIEYGMLQAYAEGFEAMSTFPHADLNLDAIANLWTHGAVVRSWILDLLVSALKSDPRLHQIAGYVDDSGMGRWTVDYAVDHAVPMPAITAALYARFASRQDESFAAKVVAALRHGFGGHATKPAEEQ
jgi:6-phosphogluconate dehydrogenase